ncbi:MAG: sigma-54-dependent Fis family transcriptional regulator [Spirochaetales bacterium]|nr:sigma-54-dependent Fis family transcriptional regulator [Spirochaetales bacterium]
MKFKILVADDEKNIREGLASALEMDGYEVYTASNGDEASVFINNNDIDLVITDLRMPKMSGNDLLKHISSSFPTIPVIILTGHGTIESAVEAMRDGAFDFITKPVNLDRLSLLVKRALSNRELVLKHRMLEEEVEKLGRANKYSKMIGKSSQMRKIFDVIQQVASTKASVLITGESGVGKELVADALHNLSNRKDSPFVKVHCAALTESLLESELFGHEKGSFTGAISDKKGRFELANKGSIFLDEIGEINQSVQIKILRVLQEREFERVGGEKTVSVDVRVIAATNKDLKKEIEGGNFREDLFYRLNVVNIHVPPLRERREDISLLVTSFISEFSDENGKKIEGIDSKAMSALYNYSWPGNIRELRNCIESAVVMCRSDFIGIDDLPPSVAESTEGDFIRIKPGSSMSEVERLVILETLKRENGNKSKTAKILNMGRKTLYQKLSEYGIE